MTALINFFEFGKSSEYSIGWERKSSSMSCKVERPRSRVLKSMWLPVALMGASEIASLGSIQHSILRDNNKIGIVSRKPRKQLLLLKSQIPVGCFEHQTQYRYQ